MTASDAGSLLRMSAERRIGRTTFDENGHSKVWGQGRGHKIRHSLGARFSCVKKKDRQEGIVFSQGYIEPKINVVGKIVCREAKGTFVEGKCRRDSQRLLHRCFCDKLSNFYFYFLQRKMNHPERHMKALYIWEDC